MQRPQQLAVIVETELVRAAKIVTGAYDALHSDGAPFSYIQTALYGERLRSIIAELEHLARQAEQAR